MIRELTDKEKLFLIEMQLSGKFASSTVERFVYALRRDFAAFYEGPTPREHGGRCLYTLENIGYIEYHVLVK